MKSKFGSWWYKNNKHRSSAKLNQRHYDVERLEDRVLLTTVTFNSPTSNGGDGTWVLEQREGVNVHISTAPYLYYNVNPFSFPGFQTGSRFYVQVNYYDEGSGTLRVQYDSQDANFDMAPYSARSSLVDTQEFVSSYFVLDDVQFANGTNGSDFRVVANGAPISSVLISDEPFPNSGLDWVNNIPWEAPYEGPSRNVDASTLNGKMLTGYQGWFNTPNDPTDKGYFHWGDPNGDWSIDQWPDQNDYDSTELFAVPGVTTASGDQAYLFSSATSKVVDRHFQWMREHDIDGVFLQRFRNSFMYKQADGFYEGEPQWPLVNARDAAHREGRTWAIEYDIQNGGSTTQERDAVIQDVKDDWEFLIDNGGLDMLNDSHYQRHDGKPVVAIFGLYVSPTNTYSDAQQADLINYFKNQGVYVIGAGRHSQNPNSQPQQVINAGLHDAYIPWQGYWAGQSSYTPADNTLNGVTEHIPHVFPGFSWTHLQDDDTATSVDRENGSFYWRMLADAINETDAPWLFIGMFDEYDEATNLIPASDDPPVPDTDAQGDSLLFQTSDPLPNDWWMNLTGAAKQALQNKISINDTIPTESDLENRSNTGGEVYWKVADEERLSIVPNAADGLVQTASYVVDGESFDAAFSAFPYLYFQVDDSFLFQEQDGRDVTVLVEYLDNSTGTFRLEYESNQQTTEFSEEVLLTNSGDWRTHRFEISNAYFANGQNNSSDFRIHRAGGNLHVRDVRVAKENMLVTDVDLGGINLNNGMTQVTVGDGNSTVVNIDGREARLTTGTSSSRYLYFNINDDYANQVNAGLNAAIEVVYQDVGTGTIQLQYDALDAAYKVFGSVQLENSGEWRTHRFYVDDALFANRQNNGTDFRFRSTNVPIDKVSVLRSFGDIYEPSFETNFVNTIPNGVVVLWTVDDDWKTGIADQWTDQQDNLVKLEWTDDDGVTWNHVANVYEGQNGTSQSNYDVATGTYSWTDFTTWQTGGLPGGTYKVRVTPIDGRGNQGESFVSSSFALQGPPALPGDYNNDGSVDIADYSVWRDNQGSIVNLPNDITPGTVTSEDYTEWVNNFGQSLPSSSQIQALHTGDPIVESTLIESLPLNTEVEEALASSVDPASYSINISQNIQTSNRKSTIEAFNSISFEDKSGQNQELLLLLGNQSEANLSNENIDDFFGSEYPAEDDNSFDNNAVSNPLD